MRKSVLALSIATMIGGLGLSGVASAGVIPGTATLNAGASTMDKTDATTLTVSQGGVGHMLLVPYFTTQNNNMTVLHVVNTDTSNGKAVKVRFRGAANSDDIMDFQVFMSPGDVWTAAIKAGADGISTVESADNTCTVPALSGMPQTFATLRLNQGWTASTQANHTREGYVEIFNMADIPSNKIYTVGTNDMANSPLYTAIKHANGVAPCSVADSTAKALLDSTAITNFTSESQAFTAGFNTPSGGLMGDWYIINVGETTTFSGGATAIVAGGDGNRGNFVHFPQDDGTVSTARAETWTADPLLRTGLVAAANYDFPDLSTPYLNSVSTTEPIKQADALTTSLAVTSVTNQYANDEVITAKTDWTFSMPTRRYHVAADYSVEATDSAYRVFSTNSWFSSGNTSVESATGNICVNADNQRFWDREETTPGQAAGVPVFSPQRPGVVKGVEFCGEASVLAFRDDGKSVLAADVARTTITSNIYENGWGQVSTANGGVGLPILGSSFIKLTNPEASTQFSGTYGITWPHRFTKPATKE